MGTSVCGFVSFFGDGSEVEFDCDRNFYFLLTSTINLLSTKITKILQTTTDIMRTIETASLQRSSAVRPNSLDLDNALTLDMDCVFQELDDNNSNNNNNNSAIPTNTGTRNSRKKRKRAAIKKFSDLYEE